MPLEQLIGVRVRVKGMGRGRGRRRVRVRDHLLLRHAIMRMLRMMAYTVWRDEYSVTRWID